MHDVRFQWRHGFYAAYVLVCLLYIVLLFQLPERWKESAAVIILFSDPAALGFFFIGGIILLEKSQGIYSPLFITPIRLGSYLWSKALSLGMLSVVAGGSIHVIHFPMGYESIYVFSGLLLSSIFFTLLGTGVAAACHTLNRFFFLSPLYASWLMLPLLGYFGIYETSLYSLLPTHSALVLLQASYDPFSVWTLIWAYAVLLFSIVMVYFWAAKKMKRYVIYRVGDE
ncbi:ABC transporter permease [Marinicrinis lubricantis]